MPRHALVPSLWHPLGMDDSDKEQIGKAAGLGAGMLGGAKLGQLIIPIPVVGGFVGAVLGGAAGTEIGKRLGKALINGATAFVETLQNPSIQRGEVLIIEEG